MYARVLVVGTVVSIDSAPVVSCTSSCFSWPSCPARAPAPASCRRWAKTSCKNTVFLFFICVGAPAPHPSLSKSVELVVKSVLEGYMWLGPNNEANEAFKDVDRASLASFVKGLPVSLRLLICKSIAFSKARSWAGPWGNFFANFRWRCKALMASRGRLLSHWHDRHHGAWET